MVQKVRLPVLVVLVLVLARVLGMVWALEHVEKVLVPPPLLPTLVLLEGVGLLEVLSLDHLFEWHCQISVELHDRQELLFHQLWRLLLYPCEREEVLLVGQEARQE